MFKNASSQNEFWFNTITYLLHCMTETSSVMLQWLHETGMKTSPGSLGQLIGQVLIRNSVSEFDNFLLHFRVWVQAFKARFCVKAYKTIAVVLAVMIKTHHLSDLCFRTEMLGKFEHNGPYSRKRTNHSPGTSLNTKTWFIFLLFWKFISPAQNSESS